MMDLSPNPLGWSHLYALTCFATFVLAFLLAVFVLWKNPKHPAGSIHRLLNQRRMAYETCQITIRTDGLTPNEVVERIIHACRNGMS